MIIQNQITIEASEVTESMKVYFKYEKKPMYKEELNWSDEKINHVLDGGQYETGDYVGLLELALKIQIAELSQNNEFLISVSS